MIEANPFLFTYSQDNIPTLKTKVLIFNSYQFSNASHLTLKNPDRNYTFNAISRYGSVSSITAPSGHSVLTIENENGIPILIPSHFTFLSEKVFKIMFYSYNCYNNTGHAKLFTWN
jgi:hypothetical protein